MYFDLSSLLSMCLGDPHITWCEILMIYRNQDFQEVVLEVEDKPVLKFALAYGFRNIQNIVQKVKRGKCSYHFVEVMACPSGKV